MRRYEPTPEQTAEIDNLFTHHPPTGDQAERYTSVRSCIRRTAHDLLALCPPSAEREVALDHLRMAMMMANAAIACREVPQ